MEIYQNQYTTKNHLKELTIDFSPDVFFLFISPSFQNPKDFVKQLYQQHPDSLIIGCSTSGEIRGNEVLDGTVVLTAVKFDKTKLKLVHTDLDDHDMDSYKTGKTISETLVKEKLRHIFVLSDGLEVNGAELVSGLYDNLDKSVSITGGLAGDGADFKETFVVYNGEIASKKVVALGLYGDDLKIGFASKGGWDSFGLERLVTKSDKNILYELDRKPALELYKSYLGDKAKDLPGSGLLFPLSMRDKNQGTPVVRTILGINEENNSLTFAGNIPKGSYVRLMKANVDRLIDGAEQSATTCKKNNEGDAKLAFLISCVGRRLVLKQLVEEEVEAVNEQLGEDIYSTGFYSYGEIAPFDKFSPCELHNQTMTITTFAE